MKGRNLTNRLTICQELREKRSAFVDLALSLPGGNVVAAIRRNNPRIFPDDAPDVFGLLCRDLNSVRYALAVDVRVGDPRFQVRRYSSSMRSSVLPCECPVRTRSSASFTWSSGYVPSIDTASGFSAGKSSAMRSSCAPSS